MFVVMPASTGRVASVAVGGRLLGGEHVDRHGTGHGVALLVVDGVGERGRPGEPVVGIEGHGERAGAVGDRRGRAALRALAAGEEQRVAVGVGGLAGEVDGDRLVGRRLDA